MALLRTKEIRALDGPGREKKLKELRDELMHERGVAAMGGAPPNPGKIRALRKNISRIHTIEREELRTGVPTPTPASPPPEEKEARPKPTRKPEPGPRKGDEADEDDEDLDLDEEEDER
jgi:large subunit ribosomal protein L29